jgi:amidohydrolase
MHACGHDGHMAIALGLIRRLVEDGWQTRGEGEILFLFQPAEEGGAGAKAMLDTGLFDAEPLKAIFAAHLTPEWPTGQVELVSGKAFAAVDLLEFTIRGKGGHGAAPDQCVDPIVAAAQLIGQLQGVVSHGIDPLDHAVLTIGQIHAGTAANVIPDKAQLRGTLRTLNGQVRTQILGKIDRILAGLEQGFGVTIELENKEGYPVLVNHPGLHDHVFDCAAGLLGRQNIILGKPSMGSEDFAFFSDRWPGMMVWLGCRRPGEAFSYGLHSPHFDLDEAALAVAVDLFVEVITRFMASGDAH